MHEICCEARLSPGAILPLLPGQRRPLSKRSYTLWVEDELAALRGKPGSFTVRLEQAAGRLLERFLGADGALAADILAESARNEWVHWR